MKTLRYLSVCIILSLISSFVSIQALPPQNGFRGAFRNGIFNEKGLLDEWPAEGPVELWSIDDAGKGYSSPTVAENMVFVTGLNEVGDKEKLSAYTLDGKKRWAVEYGEPWSKNYTHARCCPTIANGRAYVVSGNCDVACINVATGTIEWSVSVGKVYQTRQAPFGTSEAPIVYDNKVIVTPVGEKATMVALDALTGKEIWTTPPIDDAKCSFTSPALIEHKGKVQIVAVVFFDLLGIDIKTGKIMWRTNEWLTEDVTRDIALCNSPIYENGSLFFSDGYDGGGWKYSLDESSSSAKQLWKNKEFDVHHGGYVLVNETLYGSNWTTNTGGNWMAVDWNTGKTLYETPWEGRGKGCIISAGSHLIAYEERRGTVALVRPSREKFDIVSQFRITKGDGPHWAHPIVHKGIMYIRHGEALMAFNIKK